MEKVEIHIALNAYKVRDHCHLQRSEGVDVKARKKLIIASVLCLVFMIAEVVGGVLSNSLAIATDAAHLLTDFASFMISLFAIWIAGRPSTQRMSFGWYRAEVIGALASVVMIWFITAILVWLAIQRVIHQDFEVDAKIMLITSGLAILVNLIMGAQLHGHDHGHHGHSHTSHGHSHDHGVKAKKEKKNKAKVEAITATNAATPRISDSLKQIELFEGSIDTPKTSKPPSASLERLEDGISALAVENQANHHHDHTHDNRESQAHAAISAAVADTAATGAYVHHGGIKEQQNLNVRAAFIHVVGDLVQSVGVFLAALLIYFRPDWVIADPICTFIFSIIVLYTTFAIMRDALLVLMEGTPNYMHYAEVLETFKRIEGVERVHNLRIWALSINKTALSVHLAVGPNANAKQILQDASTAIHMYYNFFETTIQIEDFTPDMESCNQCTVPAK